MERDLPIHDNLGEVVPNLRQEHFAESVTPEASVEHSSERTSTACN